MQIPTPLGSLGLACAPLQSRPPGGCQDCRCGPPPPFSSPNPRFHGGRRGPPAVSLASGPVVSGRGSSPWWSVCLIGPQVGRSTLGFYIYKEISLLRTRKSWFHTLTGRGKQAVERTPCLQRILWLLFHPRTQTQTPTHMLPPLPPHPPHPRQGSAASAANAEGDGVQATHCHPSLPAWERGARAIKIQSARRALSPLPCPLRASSPQRCPTRLLPFAVPPPPAGRWAAPGPLAGDSGCGQAGR